MEADRTSSLGLDRLGQEVLAEEECWRLVAAAPVGRVAVVSGGQPLIFPVNHALVEHRVVFITAPGSKLSAALMEQPVAFEVDAWNARDRHGWSVVIEGIATVVTDSDEIRALETTRLEPWASSAQQTEWVRIIPHDVSGRRVRGRGRAQVGD